MKWQEDEQEYIYEEAKEQTITKGTLYVVRPVRCWFLPSFSAFGSERRHNQNGKYSGRTTLLN